MKTHFTKAHLKQSIISFLILGLFAFLATGSLDSLVHIAGIGVHSEHLGDNIYRETETHAASNRVIIYKGPKDDKGRWSGWVDIEYGEGINMVHQFKERVFMVHGKRNGISTRTYPGGKVEEDHYIAGIKVSKKKSASSIQAGGSAFNLLQSRQPWFLFAFEAFQFDSEYMESFLDTLESLMAGYTFGPEEFDSYYYQVNDTLSETPYDSIIQANDAWSIAFGVSKMKEDELRQAVIDMYRSGSGTTFNHLKLSYPNYIKEINTQGVNETDLETFCNALDDSLSMFQDPDPEDAFFVDSVDSHLFTALISFQNLEKSASVSNWKTAAIDPGRDPGINLRKALTELDLSGPATTPEEVAGFALNGMLLKLLEGDLLYWTVYDAYRARGSIPGLPSAGTEFVSVNSATSVILNGYVIEDGGANVTTRGIAWADFYNPTVGDHSESSGSGIGAFLVTLEGLTEGKTYFARAYATNSEGTAYGNVISFKTTENSVGTAGTYPTLKILTLYPNPASTSVVLTVHAETGSNLEVILTDLGGRIVYQDNLSDGISGKREISELQEMRLDVSALPDGIYLCSVKENGISLGTRQLVITK